MIWPSFEGFITDGVISSHRGAVFEGEQDFNIAAWLQAIEYLQTLSVSLSVPPGGDATADRVSSYRGEVADALGLARRLLERSEYVHPPEHIAPRDTDSESTIEAEFFSIRARLVRITARLVDLAELSGYLNGVQTVIRHQVGQGETLKHLALVYYGDADRWTVIADRNGVYPGDETVGQTLLIPVRK